MTIAELDDILDDVSAALVANQEFLTPDMLPRIQKLWSDVKDLGGYIKTSLCLTDDQLANAIAVVDRIIAAETNLITTGQTTKFVNAVAALRSHYLLKLAIVELL